MAGDHLAAVADGAAALGLRRVVLDRRIAAPEIDAFSGDRGWSPAGDAMLELWFEDAEGCEAALTSADGEEALARIEAVERELADTTRSSAVLTREHVVFDLFPEAMEEAAPDRVKLVVQNHALPSLSPEQFMAHWIERYAPLVSVAGPALGYRRYVQNHPMDSAAVDAYARRRGWRQAPNGGVSEVWWESRESQLTAFASEEGLRASAPSGGRRRWVYLLSLSAGLNAPSTRSRPPRRSRRPSSPR